MSWVGCEIVSLPFSSIPLHSDPEVLLANRTFVLVSGGPQIRRIYLLNTGKILLGKIGYCIRNSRLWLEFNVARYLC